MLHASEFRDVRIDDHRKVDLVQIYLFTKNQVQQQIKGTFEHWGLHCVSHFTMLAAIWNPYHTDVICTFYPLVPPNR